MASRLVRWRRAMYGEASRFRGGQRVEVLINGQWHPHYVQGVGKDRLLIRGRWYPPEQVRPAQ